MLAISVSSSIDEDGIIEGNRLEKKSFKAVATAFTGMSSCLMETFESNGREKYKQRKRRKKKDKERRRKKRERRTFSIRIK